MKFDELRNYLENEIKLGKVTFPPDAEQLGSSKKYQFIAVLSLFENNGEATWEQIKTRLGQLDPTYTGGPEVRTSIVKKKVAEEKRGKFHLLDYDAYNKRQKTVIINICEEKIQKTQSWVIKPGYKGRDWNKHLENNIIGMGVRNFDLSKFYDKNGEYIEGSNTKVKEKLESLISHKDFPNNTPEEAKSRRGKIDQAEISLHDFMRIQQKDFIYAYDNEKILGIGRITDDYFFRENEEHCHTYKVDWYDPKDELDRYREITRKIAPELSKKKEKQNKELLQIFFSKRANIIKNAAKKIDALQKILQKNNNKLEYCLIYCAPGQSKDDEQIKKVQDVLNKIPIPNSIIKSGITSDAEKEKILTQIASGVLNVGLAINILDQGIDIPPLKTAILLSSTGNKKQFIQRRGRILRKWNGGIYRDGSKKEHAVIYDIFVVPYMNKKIIEFAELEKTIVEKELRRHQEMAEISLNPDFSMGEINKIKEVYGCD